MSRRREGGEKEGSSFVCKRRFFLEEDDDDEPRLDCKRVFSEGDEDADAVDNREDWERVTRRPVVIPVASTGSAVALIWTFCVCVCVCVCLIAGDTVPAVSAFVT